ncbi:MAG: LysR family transcriptional regulator [Rhizobiaceae bacterium]
MQRHDQYDWNLLKCFLAVMEHGSLTSAARKLGVSQPTLGRHISELESSLGVLLFERGREGLIPTHAATAIAAGAQSARHAAETVARAAAGDAREITGTIRITGSEMVAAFLLTPIISQMLAETPDLEVEIVPTNTVENLLRRDADIAIRMVRPTQPELIARKVNDMKIGIYAHRKYLQANPLTLNVPEDLAGHVVIGYDRSDLIIDGLRQAGLEVDRHFFRYRCDNQITCHEALKSGVGIGFAPRYLASGEPDLVELGHHFPIPSLPMWLVTHSEVRSSARVRTVFDFLAEKLSGMDLERAT